MKLPFPEPRIRPFLAFVIGLFAVTAVSGYLAPEAVREKLVAVFRAFVAPVRDLSSDRLFLFILVQNTRASFIAVVSGLAFGLLPMVFAAANGFVLGVVCRTAAGVVPIGAVALRILPHGVFELPALFLASAYGLWLGSIVLRRIGGDESPRVGASLKHALRMYLLVILPLLLVAATIEAFVTPRLIR
jgi:stage II sporulation protein M